MGRGSRQTCSDAEGIAHALGEFVTRPDFCDYGSKMDKSPVEQDKLTAARDMLRALHEVASNLSLNQLGMEKPLKDIAGDGSAIELNKKFIDDWATEQDEDEDSQPLVLKRPAAACPGSVSDDDSAKPRKRSKAKSDGSSIVEVVKPAAVSSLPNPDEDDFEYGFDAEMRCAWHKKINGGKKAIIEFSEDVWVPELAKRCDPVMAKFPNGYVREVLMCTVAMWQNGEDQAPAAKLNQHAADKEKTDKPSEKGKSPQQQGEEFETATGAGEKKKLRWETPKGDDVVSVNFIWDGPKGSQKQRLCRVQENGKNFFQINCKHFDSEEDAMEFMKNRALRYAAGTITKEEAEQEKKHYIDQRAPRTAEEKPNAARKKPRTTEEKPKVADGVQTPPSTRPRCPSPQPQISAGEAGAVHSQNERELEGDLKQSGDLAKSKGSNALCLGGERSGIISPPNFTDSENSDCDQ
ncbi:unnamed protein product [Prorocentrum cordatum]|uniref:Uncharacterized protein n=1 Tax=Prorocentrum cordatum TaxID=2364126 RepID=A0ABN9X8J1_9DINO|nr:unnamed protein product [Polarella glacialis]